MRLRILVIAVSFCEPLLEGGVRTAGLITRLGAPDDLVAALYFAAASAG